MTPHPVIAVVIDELDMRVNARGRSTAALRRGLHDPGARIGECPCSPDGGAEPGGLVSTVELDDDVPGVELLGGVRRAHPDARRVLLVRRGQWASHPVRRAMVLGEVDGYLFVPWLPREHGSICRWPSTSRTGVAPRHQRSLRSPSSVVPGMTVHTPSRHSVACECSVRLPRCRLRGGTRGTRGHGTGRFTASGREVPHRRGRR